MCGIAGIVSPTEKPVTQAELSRMCAAMLHRGPDEGGYYIGDHVGLGMRRLRIIDLKTGQQPVHNEEKSVWVVLNGEIYNFKALRHELERRGHRFYTATDTEVIVHLYEEYGPQCVSHMRGMFAFALWDATRKSLLLARDRLGIKPLYYVEVDGRFAFASEVKVLLQLPELDRQLNWQSVNHLFSSLTTPASESIIAGVHKLEPAHTLTLSLDGEQHLTRYWDVRFEPEYGISEQEWAFQLRERLEESVRLHMVADVPLGAFLSGGIDSSAVVATMAGLSPRPIKTFSIGFSVAEFSEVRHARLVANHFLTEHHELNVEPSDASLLDELTWYLDEPFGDSSAIPTYLVSRLAAGEVTVVLSGDGGDELFAGYDKYVIEQSERRFQSFAAPVRSVLRAIAQVMPEGMKGKNFLRHHSLKNAERYLDALMFLRPEQGQQLFSREVQAQIHADEPWRESVSLLATADRHWLSRLQYFDLQRYLPLDILTKVDRMSMANSIEARVPLLDHAFVEFAARIPPELKLRGNTTKYIFKQAMRGVLPDAVLDRPKQGFAVPIGHWFRGPLAGYLREHLLSDRFRQRGIFNAGYVERLIRLHEQGRPLELQLWALLSFELWCRQFLDQRVYLSADMPMAQAAEA